MLFNVHDVSTQSWMTCKTFCFHKTTFFLFCLNALLYASLSLLLHSHALWLSLSLYYVTLCIISFSTHDKFFQNELFFYTRDTQLMYSSFLFEMKQNSYVIASLRFHYFPHKKEWTASVLLITFFDMRHEPNQTPDSSLFFFRPCKCRQTRKLMIMHIHVCILNILL